MSLPALPATADTRSITERVNVLIRHYNTQLRVPAGGIMPYAGATAPDGWLLCNGQAVSRATYADLFAALGTTYGGGDGSTTFNLPDLRGRVVAGKDDMGGTSANRLTGQAGGVNGDSLGATGGEERHTLAGAEAPPTGPFASFAPSGASVLGLANDGATLVYNRDPGFGGDAHNNVQPTLILNYVIAT